MNLDEVKKIASKVDKALFKSTNESNIGSFKSQFKGSGLQFKEHQVYNPGDDVRFIDWKLSAKTRHTYIKTFEEERNLEIYVVVDFSNSLLIGHYSKTKLEALLEIAALVSFVAHKTKDRVRFIFLYDEIYQLKPSSGLATIYQIINLLEKKYVYKKDLLEPSFETIKKDIDLLSLDEKYKFMRQLASKKKNVVFLSDFSDRKMRQLFHEFSRIKNHHLVRVYSDLEKDEFKFPFSIQMGFKEGLGSYKVLRGQSRSDLPHRITEVNIKDNYLESFLKKLV